MRRFLAGHRWYSRIEAWVQRRGLVTIFMFAAIPVPLFDVVGFASGSLGFPVQRFVFACWLGRVLKFTVVSLAGYWGASATMGLFS